VKPHIAELVLNHVGHKAGIAGVYDTHDYIPDIAEALTTWAVHLMEIVGQPNGGNVVSLKRSA
jgi:hypothetical protein